MKPKIELTSVIQALAVADHLSFRHAAQALGVCQSSVSKRVMNLENLLGVDLFDRHHAGVKVTNAGAHFFDEVRRALETLDCAVKSAGMAGRVERGRLKVGIFSSLASGFLPELLRRYSALHPNIDVSFVEGVPRENLALLRAEQLDIAFVMGEPVACDCDVVRFWSERMFVVLPEALGFAPRIPSPGKICATKYSFSANPSLGLHSMTMSFGAWPHRIAVQMSVNF